MIESLIPADQYLSPSLKLTPTKSVGMDLGETLKAYSNYLSAKQSNNLVKSERYYETISVLFKYLIDNYEGHFIKLADEIEMNNKDVLKLLTIQKVSRVFGRPRDSRLLDEEKELYLKFAEKFYEKLHNSAHFQLN